MNDELKIEIEYYIFLILQMLESDHLNFFNILVYQFPLIIKLDYKTNKEIKRESYTNWEGISDKMLDPVGHLDDCNLNHYNIQLSLYMYIILKHNPKLKAGKLIIEHIQFKEAGKDAYDNRVVYYDEFGEPQVDKIVHYELPYLKTEVISIINHMKNASA